MGDGQNFVASLSEENRSTVDLMSGVIAALLATICSGTAGVYFERVLKTGKVNIWVRNVHLALVSVVVGIGGHMWERISHDPAEFLTSPARLYELMQKETDFVASAIPGLEQEVFIVLLMHCYGGLLVSLVIKYTDTIVKALAAAISIVLASSVSVLLFDDFAITPGFLVGAVLVTITAYTYSVCK